MMEIELSIEDFTIIQNALHYYKKVDKLGHFAQYDDARINQLRDHLAKEMMNWQAWSD